MERRRNRRLQRARKRLRRRWWRMTNMLTRRDERRRKSCRKSWQRRRLGLLRRLPNLRCVYMNLGPQFINIFFCNLAAKINSMKLINKLRGTIVLPKGSSQG
jgi:hypothetical protein